MATRDIGSIILEEEKEKKKENDIRSKRMQLKVDRKKKKKKLQQQDHQQTTRSIHESILLQSPSLLTSFENPSQQLIQQIQSGDHEMGTNVKESKITSIEEEEEEERKGQGQNNIKDTILVNQKLIDQIINSKFFKNDSLLKRSNPFDELSERMSTAFSQVTQGSLIQPLITRRFSQEEEEKRSVKLEEIQDEKIKLHNLGRDARGHTSIITIDDDNDERCIDETSMIKDDLSNQLTTQMKQNHTFNRIVSVWEITFLKQNIMSLDELPNLLLESLPQCLNLFYCFEKDDHEITIGLELLEPIEYEQMTKLLMKEVHKFGYIEIQRTHKSMMDLLELHSYASNHDLRWILRDDNTSSRTLEEKRDPSNQPILQDQEYLPALPPVSIPIKLENNNYTSDENDRECQIIEVIKISDNEDDENEDNNSDDDDDDVKEEEDDDEHYDGIFEKRFTEQSIDTTKFVPTLETQPWAYFEVNEKRQRKREKWDEVGFVYALIGKPASGKSIHVSYVLRHYFYDHFLTHRILFYSPKSLPEMKDWMIAGKNWFPGVSYTEMESRIESMYKEFADITQIVERPQNKRPIHFLIVIDDRIAFLNQTQYDTSIKDYIFQRRHACSGNVILSFLITSQRYIDIPKYFRENMTHASIYRVSEKVLNYMRDEGMILSSTDIMKWPDIKREIRRHWGKGWLSRHNFVYLSQDPYPIILGNMNQILIADTPIPDEYYQGQYPLQYPPPRPKIEPQFQKQPVYPFYPPQLSPPQPPPSHRFLPSPFTPIHPNFSSSPSSTFPLLSSHQIVRPVSPFQEYNQRILKREEELRNHPQPRIKNEFS